MGILFGVPSPRFREAMARVIPHGAHPLDDLSKPTPVLWLNGPSAGVTFFGADFAPICRLAYWCVLLLGGANGGCSGAMLVAYADITGPMAGQVPNTSRSWPAGRTFLKKRCFGLALATPYRLSRFFYLDSTVFEFMFVKKNRCQDCPS